MKGRVWLVVSGAGLVLVLDTLRSRQRRDQVLGWLQSTRQRLFSGSNAAPETPGRDETDPGVAGTIRVATDGLQSVSEDLAPRPVPDPIPEHDPNDPTLVARVESELFRDPALPKGALAIDAANGVVTLRGTVSAATATDLLERTGAIEGVARVVDLLKRD